MSDYELIHLKGLHFSGRAVKFQALGPDEADAVFEQAGKSVDTDSGTMLDLRRMEWKLGVRQMIKFVSEPLPPGADPMGADVKWTKYTPQTLDEKFNDLFGAKDSKMLTSIYRAYHEVAEAEVMAVMGKAMTVSGS